MNKILPKSTNFKMPKKDIMHEIYFNKKSREKLKKDFLVVQNSGIEILERTTNKTDYKSADDRILAEKFVDLGSLYLDTIKKAEKSQPYFNVVGSYVLYKFGANYIYHLTPVILGKLRHRFLTIYGGRLGKSKRKFKLVKRKMPTLGFLEIERGKYRSKQTDFTKGYFVFWNNVRTKYPIKITSVSKYIYKGEIDKGN